MKTCSSCKYWKQPDEYQTGHSQGLGVCEAAEMFWNCTEWRENYEGRVFKAEYKNRKAFVQDGSDYKAYLLTKPDFGCLQYEEK